MNSAPRSLLLRQNLSQRQWEDASKSTVPGVTNFMPRDYLPFNFPGDKSYVEALLEQAVKFRDELQTQADASEDRSNDALLGFIEKNQAAQEIVDTLMLWLNS